MNVPNHEMKAFKDITPEERSAIVEAWIDGGIDFLTDDKQWVEKLGPIGAYSIYRTRPRQLVIPWQHIKPEYKFASIDEDGYLFFHGENPRLCRDGWWSTNSKIDSTTNIDTTGIDWRESLVQRPE